MNRIDGANYVTVGGKREFSSGSPGVTPPTSLTAKWFTDIQEEVVELLEAAGLTPTDATFQLLAALRLLSLTATNDAPFKGSANAGKARCYMWPGVDGTHGTRIDLTINAAWNSGSSQWDPDTNSSPSIMLRLACGASGGIAPSAADVGLFRNDSGASFAEAAWVRGINGIHGLPYGGGHWSDAGGGTTPSTYRTSLDGRVWLAGTAINDGTAGTIATLPAGARPATPKVFPAVTFNGAYSITTVFVATNGAITTATSGAGVLIYLDGISFSLTD
jgi:hypothetical protein